MESEETQDYVRETLAISQEEADEIGFVPSAPGQPRGAIYWCDSRCSEKTIRKRQIAPMVIEEGGEARTINLCKLCHNAKLVQQGKQPWKEVVEKKAHRGRPRNVSGNEQFLRGMWKYVTLKRAGARKTLATLLKKNKKNNKVSGNKSVPSKKFCNKSKRSADTDLRSPDNAPCLQRNEAWQLGKCLRMNAGRKEG